MGTFEIAVVSLLAATFVISVIALAATLSGSRKLKESQKDAVTEEKIQSLREELRDDIDGSRRETAENIQNSFKTYGETIAKAQSEQALRQNEQAKLQGDQIRAQNERLREMNEAVDDFGKTNGGASADRSEER